MTELVPSYITPIRRGRLLAPSLITRSHVHRLCAHLLGLQEFLGAFRTCVPVRSYCMMSNWAPLAPSKPGGPSKFPAAPFTSVLKPSKPSVPGSISSGPFVGRWPESILLRMIEYLPVPDLPNVARASRALSRVVRDERGWEARCRYMGLKPEDGELSVTRICFRLTY